MCKVTISSFYILLFSALNIKFEGSASTSWDIHESHYDLITEKDVTEITTHSARETYFNSEFNLAGGIQVMFLKA